MGDGGLMKPALDPAAVPVKRGGDHPAPFRATIAAREKRSLGDALGLTNFGVNLVRLPPGAPSTLRHWHSRQDEFIYVLKGELVLVTEAGEQVLKPGTAAGFPAGVADGHVLVNRSRRAALYLEVGDRSAGDEVDYPDIDLLVRWIDGVERYVHKDGTPYSVKGEPSSEASGGLQLNNSEQLRLEERYVAVLLSRYLRKTGHGDVKIRAGEDPPDLICEFGDWRWAVEVTYANQQVAYGGQNVARHHRLDKLLLEFGNKLGSETEELRTRKYLLMLGWPPYNENFTLWKKRIRKKVLEFIGSGALGKKLIDEASGSEIIAFEDGHPWQVAIIPALNLSTPNGAMLSDIASNRQEVLYECLSRKVPKLANIANFDERILVLINTYYYGDDIRDITNVVQKLVRSNESFDVIDRIFYVTEQNIYEIYTRNKCTTACASLPEE